MLRQYADQLLAQSQNGGRRRKSGRASANVAADRIAALIAAHAEAQSNALPHSAPVPKKARLAKPTGEKAAAAVDGDGDAVVARKQQPSRMAPAPSSRAEAGATGSVGAPAAASDGGPHAQARSSPSTSPCLPLYTP